MAVSRDGKYIVSGSYNHNNSIGKMVVFTLKNGKYIYKETLERNISHGSQFGNQWQLVEIIII